MIHKTRIAFGCVFALLTMPCLAQNECTSGNVPDCIERGIYKPCDLGGSIGTRDCAWGYAEMEERRIKRLENQIEQAFSDHKLSPAARTAFHRWQTHSRQYRNASCKQSSKLADIIVEGVPGIVNNGTDFHEGFCLRSANEVRRKELTRFLEIAKQ